MLLQQLVSLFLSVLDNDFDFLVLVVNTLLFLNCGCDFLELLTILLEIDEKLSRQILSNQLFVFVFLKQNRKIKISFLLRFLYCYFNFFLFLRRDNFRNHTFLFLSKQVFKLIYYVLVSLIKTVFVFRFFIF